MKSFAAGLLLFLGTTIINTKAQPTRWDVRDDCGSSDALNDTPSAASSAVANHVSASSSNGIKYLISFGDSYSQTGFEPDQTLASTANPLGNPTFPGYTTTGGENWIGYYITEFNSSTIYSYNFADGGATTDASLVQPFESTVLSYVNQVDKYLTSTKTIDSFVQWDASNSMYATWIGVNDVGNAFGSSDFDTLVSEIMDQRVNQTQALYDSGARNFMFLTVPPINRTPNLIAQGSSATSQIATAITQYNSALESAVAKFSTTNSAVKTWIVDSQKPFTTALDNPGNYGASDATCYDSSGTKCLWWNNYHPGQAIHKLVAQAVSETLGNW